MKKLLVVLLVALTAAPPLFAQGFDPRAGREFNPEQHDPRFDPFKPGHRSGNPDLLYQTRPPTSAFPALPAPISPAERAAERACIEAARGVIELAIPFHTELVRLNGADWNLGYWGHNTLMRHIAAHADHARRVAQHYLWRGDFAPCVPHMRNVLAEFEARWTEMVGERSLRKPDHRLLFLPCRWPESLAGTASGSAIMRYRAQNSSCADLQGVNRHL